MNRKPGTNRSPFPWCSDNLKVAAHLFDALAHTDNSDAERRGQGRFLGMKREADAVVLHLDGDPARRAVDADACAGGARVALHVR